MKALTQVMVGAAAAISIVALTAPAQAATVFATTTTIGATPNFAWTNSNAGNTGSGGTLSGSGSTFFSFENLSPALDALVFVPATFALSATVTNDPATNSGPPTNLWTQTGLGGTFTYDYSGATGMVDGVMLTHGENLLTGTFTDAWIQGNGGTGSWNLSLGNGGVLTYSSALPGVAAPAGSTSEFAYNLLNVTPTFGSTGPTAALRSFTAKGDGTFDFAASVPEPATWGLMIVGFGGMGVMIRRRRTSVVAA